MQVELLPKVTPSLLRAADEMCARRLACDFGGERGSDSPVGRARLREAFLESARNAHARLRRPTLEHFVAPGELEPEEQAVFRHAARWYVALFGARRVETHFHGLDAPAPAAGGGVRIGGWVDLTVSDARGLKELRQLDLWGGPPRGTDPLDHEAVRLALIRLSAWAGTEPVRVAWADLVHGDLLERMVDVGTELPGLRAWLDERVEVVRRRTALPDATAGRDCGTCVHVARCPEHPDGAHGSTARGDLRPGIITLTPTSLDRWHRCRREWRTKTLFALPESDQSGFTDRGARLHDLLRDVHDHGSCRDVAHVGVALARHGFDDDAAARDALDRHIRRCPTGAESLGNERELARFHRLPWPLFMATARLDALWVHDGVLDARDYKTGAKLVERVGDDAKARLQAWVLGPVARGRGLRLRLRYEQLSIEVDEDPEPYEPEDEDLDAIEEELRRIVVEIRAEHDFAGTAERTWCERCCYRSVCPDSAAPAVPFWPTPPDTVQS